MQTLLQVVAQEKMGGKPYQEKEGKTVDNSKCQDPKPVPPVTQEVVPIHDAAVDVSHVIATGPPAQQPERSGSMMSLASSCTAAPSDGDACEEDNTVSEVGSRSVATDDS